MIRPIRIFTDAILHSSCEPITVFDAQLQTLAQDMIETCFANNGIGLAAPQIGISKQFIVMNLEDKTKLLGLVNPRIVRYSKEKDTQIEGCLSSPGISVKVKRYKVVEVEGQLLNGEKVQFRFDGLDSRIVQHEIGHILGRLIVDDVKNIVRT